MRPDRERLRYLLAEQLVGADDLARARDHLRVLLAAGADPPLRERARLLELDIALRQAQAYSLGHPDRPAQIDAVRERLRALLALDPPADLALQLAQRAAAIGATDLATAAYERLLAFPAELPVPVWETAAASALQWGEHRLAARLLMRAHAGAATAAEQRRLFLAALRTLQAASLFGEALALADLHLDALAGDTDALEFLTRLALAANRPDLAQRYAILLLRISLLPALIEHWQRAGHTVPAAWRALQARIVPRVVPVQAQARGRSAGHEHERTARLPFDDALYTLSYEVFLANGNLADALVVARAAVRQVPRDLVWRRRLAQVADWSGLPDLALEQWHAIARTSGADAAWAQVRRRAAQLHATGVWIEALEFASARQPEDAATLLELASAYEEMGAPEKAVALLRPALTESGVSAQRRARLERLAAVAERNGDAQVQRAALQALLRQFDARPDVALRLAALEHAQGDDAAAHAALALAAASAQADVAGQVDYWRAYAELARATGRRTDALGAYRRLLAVGVEADDVLVNAAALLEDEDPREAAQLYDRAWQRTGQTAFATQILYLLLREGDGDAARRWLHALPPAQRAQLEADARFLVQRATVRLADGQIGGARADALRASALRPDDASIEALLIWTLIAARDAPALRARLAASAHTGGDEPLLWGPFAAGWLALQEPRRAVPWLRRLARDGGDPLWMLAYAEALEQLGSRDRAWDVRRHVWRQRARIEAGARSAQQRRDLQRRLVPLAAALLGGDAARARFDALLAADSPVAHPATPEVALAYWAAREHAELMQAWLLGQYAQALQRPAWAELSVALAAGDGERAETLLDTLADWLPVADRIEAARRVGRTAQAQTLAFEALAARPDHDDLHRRLTELVAGDRASTAAQFAGAGWRGFRQRPIDETTWLADGSVRIAARTTLGATLAQTARRTTDPEQLFDPPRHDTVAALDLAYDVGEAAAARLRLQQRDGLAGEWGWRAHGQWRAAPRLVLTAEAGQGQAATDSAYLRVGAVRDLLSIGATVRIAQREFVAATVEASRFDAQGGGAIGSGRVVRLEAGHTLRTEYPDLSVRLGYVDLDYSAEPGIAQAMLPLLPPGARAGASNALLLPASTRQIAATLAFGETARERYTRAWRPFGALGLSHDRRTGGEYAWLIGAGGSVAGGDELSLSVSAGSGLGAQTTPFRTFAVRYRWLF